MTVILVDSPDGDGPPPQPVVDLAELDAAIARFERIQSIGGGLLSHATLGLRTLRGIRDQLTAEQP